MGWEGVRWVGSHRQVKAKLIFKLKKKCCAISDLDWHNSQGRPGLLLETHTLLLMPLRGHRGHKCILGV